MKTTFFLLPFLLVASMASMIPAPVNSIVPKPFSSRTFASDRVVSVPVAGSRVTGELNNDRLQVTDPFVTDILTYTNEARAKKGLAPLVMRTSLNEIAKGHSENMAAGKVPFSHDGFKDRYQAARVQLKNIYGFAENVSFGPHSGKEAVDGWMNSKHHRENILGDYNSIGIGAAKDAKGTLYLTQVFCREQP